MKHWPRGGFIMDDKAKSGNEVIEEFFHEIMEIEGIDNKTVRKIVSLHEENKLTETNIQNAMSALLKEELSAEDGNNGKS